MMGYTCISKYKRGEWVLFAGRSSSFVSETIPGANIPTLSGKKVKKMRKIIIASFIIALIVVAVVPIALIATGAV